MINKTFGWIFFCSFLIISTGFRFSTRSLLGNNRRKRTSNANKLDPFTRLPLSSTAITSFIDTLSYSTNRSKTINQVKERLKRSTNIMNAAESVQQPRDFGFKLSDFQSMTNGLKSRLHQRPLENLARPSTNLSPVAPSMQTTNYEAPNQTDLSSNIDSPNQASHVTPQYMLDLFARFQNDPFSQPASNIVRSFFNEATQDDQVAYEEAYIACIEGHEFANCPRVHHLMFDVTSIPEHEHVTMAELRLYKIVERDRRRYVGVNRKVEVVELIRSLQIGLDQNETSSNIQRSILDSRRIIGRKSGWETFFITQAIRRWVKSGSQSTHELEVYIENIFGESEETTLEFEQSSKSTNEPLLVVFSDDTSNHHRLEHREELQELLRHGSKHGNIDPPIVFPSTGLLNNKIFHHEQQDQAEEILQRKKRSGYIPCHLERMYVDFRDIGYDSWIISPKGYPAGHCVGSCDFPFRRVTPHGVIQYFMHRRHTAQYGKPCCVPTKLGPISLLYFEKNSLTYKYNYEGLQVLECGCR